MKIGQHNTDESVYVIAEIGNNHEGDFALACQMIRLAADAGANAVKFQTIDPEHLVSASNTARIAQLRRFQFSADQFTELARVSAGHGIHFLSTPFSLAAVDMLDPLVPAFKIASGDNDFWPLIRKVAATGKPLLVSMGLGHHAGAENLVRFVEDAWREHGVTTSSLALLHCVVSYPTPPEEAALAAIETLRRPGVTVGYSDHVIGNCAAELAVAAGARIIEKHFTIDKNHSAFRDHQLSADPADLHELVASIRQIEKYLGNSGARMQNCEAGNEAAVRRSIASSRLIPQGKRIEWEDLCWIRPRSGLAPGEEARVIGKTAARNIPPGETISVDQLN